MTAGSGPGRWAGFLRRHPSRRDLAAFFDGEGPTHADAGAHVAGCRRCQAWMGELRRVRAAVRGEPVPARPPARLLRPVWAPHPAVAAAVVVVLLVGALAAGVLSSRDGDTTLASRGDRAPVPTGPGPSPGSPAGGAPSPAGGGEPAPSPSSTSSTTALAPPVQQPEPGDRAGAAPAGEITPPASSPSRGEPVPEPPAGPLRLAVVAPSSGFLAGEARAAVEAARRAVAAANRSGGAGGRPVELVVVRAEDAAALEALPARADALVGGFGVAAAPGGLPWLFPADPDVEGSAVTRAEATPAEVGARLGADLATPRPEARVGVIVFRPQDAPLADGLAKSVAVVRATGSADSTCESEVARLRRKGATALAVAGPPELARRCATAQAFWRPPDGLLLLPSAAYARLDADPAAQGARTLLGLPWPTSDEEGARRFRAVAGDRAARSYRALVTFAAVEAAVEVARATGSPSPPPSGRFRSDLYDLDGGSNRAGAVVVARFGRWARS